MVNKTFPVGTSPLPPFLPCLNSKGSSPMLFWEQGWSAASHYSLVWIWHWLEIAAVILLSPRVVSLQPGTERMQVGTLLHGFHGQFQFPPGPWQGFYKLWTLEQPWHKGRICHLPQVTELSCQRNCAVSCSSAEPALDRVQHSEGAGSLPRKPLLSPSAEQSLSPAELPRN